MYFFETKVRRLAAESLVLVVICLICAQATAQAVAGEAPAQPKLQSATNELQPVPVLPTREQWRRHPSYQVLESQAALPAMEVATNGTLKIGPHLTIELERTAQMPAQDKKALAAQFDVPVAVLDKFLQSLAAKRPVDVEQDAKDLRTLVIDYRYLRERWNQYRPPPGQEKLKTDALQSLEAGDLDKVWQMFVGLSSPAPPGGLQATKAP